MTLIARRAAPAKLNLALHITGQNASGYHLLDSLVCFTEYGDLISISPSSELEIVVRGPFAEGVPTGPGNLLWKAAKLAGHTKMRIELTKNLPHPAGIGGGSSDAAALLSMIRDHGTQLPGAEAVLSLGADVPVCLSGQTSRMRGIGEVVEPVPALPALWAVMVNPMRPAPTSEVFTSLASKTNPPLDPPDWQDASSFLDWLGRQRNDLEPPARALVPEIGRCIDLLIQQEGCSLARMSGSGATCFGLFLTARHAENAAQHLRAEQPEYWVQASAVMTSSPAGPVSS